jgi:hypothetical protein
MAITVRLTRECRALPRRDDGANGAVRQIFLSGTHNSSASVGDNNFRARASASRLNQMHILEDPYYRVDVRQPLRFAQEALPLSSAAAGEEEGQFRDNDIVCKRQCLTSAMLRFVGTFNLTRTDRADSA